MSDSEGKSNYAYVGFWRLFFNNKTSFFSIPLNIVPCVVLRSFLQRLRTGIHPRGCVPRRLDSGKEGKKVPGSGQAAKNALCLTMH